MAEPDSARETALASLESALSSDIGTAAVIRALRRIICEATAPRS